MAQEDQQLKRNVRLEAVISETGNWKFQAKRPFSTFSFLFVSWSSDRVQRKSFYSLPFGQAEASIC